MFTEDTIATAQIAQLFGSELLKVQQNATTDSGAQPDIVKIDPKQFLTNVKTPSARRAEEQRLIQMLQREAEATHPLPPDGQEAVKQTISTPAPTPAPIQVPTYQSPLTPIGQSTISSFVEPKSTADVWERINSNLERIANKLESADLHIKKKRIKRISK